MSKFSVKQMKGLPHWAIFRAGRPPRFVATCMSEEDARELAGLAADPVRVAEKLGYSVFRSAGSWYFMITGSTRATDWSAAYGSRNEAADAAIARGEVRRNG